MSKTGLACQQHTPPENLAFKRCDPLTVQHVTNRYTDQVSA